MQRKENFSYVMQIKMLHLQETDMSYFAEETKKLTAVNLADIHSIYDYKCYISGSKDGQWILLGQGVSIQG